MMYHNKFGIAFGFECDSPAEPDVGIFSDSFETTDEWEMDDYEEFVEHAPDFNWDGTKEDIPAVVEAMRDTIESHELEETAKRYRDNYDPY